MSFIVFQVIDGEGNAVGEPWANFHEARAHAAEYGPGFTVVTRRDTD